MIVNRKGANIKQQICLLKVEILPLWASDQSVSGDLEEHHEHQAAEFDSLVSVYVYYNDDGGRGMMAKSLVNYKL